MRKRPLALAVPDLSEKETMEFLPFMGIMQNRVCLQLMNYKPESRLYEHVNYSFLIINNIATGFNISTELGGKNPNETTKKKKEKTTTTKKKPNTTQKKP